MRAFPPIIALAFTLLLLLAPRCPADEPSEVRTFFSGLIRPITLDSDPQRKQARKGTMLVDKLVIYALRDAAGQRFCVSDYREYGERWLTERGQGIFIVLPRPVETFGWGGLQPSRRSAEETAVAELLAEATHRPASEFLSIPRRTAQPLSTPSAK